jgi:hypothetical protein
VELLDATTDCRVALSRKAVNGLVLSAADLEAKMV